MAYQEQIRVKSPTAGNPLSCDCQQPLSQVHFRRMGSRILKAQKEQSPEFFCLGELVCFSQFLAYIILDRGKTQVIMYHLLPLLLPTPRQMFMGQPRDEK